MSKKMKGVALDPSTRGVYEDAKTRFKHQTLMMDFQELHKEAEGMRNKLETMKHRKLTLLAEVRFLRRRHKYLLTHKSPKTRQDRVVVQPQHFETQRTNTKKDRIYSKKEATLRSLLPVFNLNQKERFFNGNESALLNPSSLSGINQKKRIYSGKEPPLQKPNPLIDLNQKGRMYIGKEDPLIKPALIFDLNQKEKTCSGKEAAVQNRAPIFDLNQISREEEEEFHETYKPPRIEEPKSCVIKVGNDEQHNDLKLSICRNVGNGSNRAGKRKISWQDQVALRV
ncbi:uncharacterized protein LOC132279710 [Cornus florida]|uniref:uncharacterized protein LOC132279710 n=1 Tax=Cornus florida TaxID=4283 RepID=UPI00289AF068|nr:uncharacterized protein LOC132279710 [Cornus florida]